MNKYLGRRLGGRYEIIDVVGVGGMAVVFRARDQVLGRYVAVKILKTEFAKDPDVRKRFSNESQAVAKLSHQNIVAVYDVGKENGVDYIVMELIEGITLKEYLQKKGRLSWQESVFFAQQICRALVHAHSRGIIHQDIKPQNVMILRDGTAKITDFGIASFATTQETRVVQEAIGSVHYISPEQAKGSQIDYRTDIYSLGVVMYEMLTGKLPFDGETALQIVMQHINAVPLTPKDIVPDIPEGLDAIVMHAMCATISKRYASAEELYADLEKIKNNVNVQFEYGMDEDDGTKVIGSDVRKAVRRGGTEERKVVQERRVVREPKPEPEPEPQEAEGFFERLAERPGLAAGMAVAVFAAIAVIVAGLLIFTGANTDDLLEVPTFVGKTMEEVMSDTETTGKFTIKEADERKESKRPEGEIIEQDPDAGTRVTKGADITLTVSSGGAEVDNTFKVSEFAGRTMDYASQILDSRGIDYEVEEEYNNEVEAGLIIRTEPGLGETLPEGETLTIYVSLGPETKYTQVPGVMGATKDGAIQILASRNLSLGSVEPVDSDAAVGIVVWQSIEEGTTVSEGTPVNVKISRGPKQETTPVPANVDNPNTDDDVVTDPESGEQGGDSSSPDEEPQDGIAVIPFTLPDSTDLVHVQISVEGSVQFDEQMDTSQGSGSATVTGSVGTHEVTVTIDGVSNTFYQEFTSQAVG